jgi:polysaccharide export outer membrane protein
MMTTTKSSFQCLITNSVFAFFLVFQVLISSCVTQRNVEYLRDKNKTSEVFKEAEVSDYRLKSNDELYIQINSLDNSAANMFSEASSQQQTAAMSPYGASLLSYAISKEGYIQLPVIGKIAVLDKTTAQVSEMIKDSLANVLNQPSVTVKLVNRFVSVLGEVRMPGHYTYSQDKFTIYNAIGLAGDITEYGNRKHVILTRNENGKNIRINLDLTNTDILSSGYYYMRPNDLVYVKPMRKKFWAMREFPYTIVFSSITTALLIYTIVNQ